MRFAILCVVAFTACDASILQVPTGPGTLYPCGTTGVVCSNATCCTQGDVCGGDDPRCPTGMCCYEGTDEDEAAKAPHRQTPQN